MDNDAWAANLGWLGRHAPSLRQRLTSGGGEPRLWLEHGVVHWRRGLTAAHIQESGTDIDAALAAVGDSPVVVLAGAGRGDLAWAVLERTAARVVLWDRDPAFLRPALRLHDWTTWLASGRLTLAVGADLLDHDGIIVGHPQLGLAYADELALMGETTAPRALVVDGTLLVDDVCAGLRAEGWAVFRWDVRDVDAEELDRTAARVAPAVVVAVNHTHGLAEACERLGVPLVEWEIDPSTDVVAPTRAGGASVLTWRRSQVETYRQAGFAAAYLPLAANPERRRPAALDADARATYGVPVAYVGSSMVARGRDLAADFLAWFARIHGDDPAAHQGARALADGILELQRQAGRRYVVPALLARAAPDLARRFAQAGCPHRPDALLGEAAAAGYRLRTLAAVAPLGLHLWGDAGWQALEAHGAVYRGWAGHFHELTRIYSGGAVHVDVGRIYQLDIVPMRIFDVLAAGGFVLAEHSEALADCFELGVEVEAWASVDELVDKAAYYVSRPAAAERIAARGRTRVLAEHTVQHRVRSLLDAAGVRTAA